MEVLIKISILIPIYRTEKYIQRCAESLFMQTYDNIEYIFVDDYSPDNSIEKLEQVLEKYPNRKPFTKILRHTQNKGLSSTRNTGLDNATGTYVMFVDSDDFLEENCVEKVISEIKHTVSDAVLFGFNHVFTDKIIPEGQYFKGSKDEYIQSMIERKTPVCVWGGAYKRTLFSQNAIRFIDGLNFGEDYVTKPRLLHNAERIVFLKDCLYNYIHYNSFSYTSTFNNKCVYDVLQAVNILSEYFKNYYSKSIQIALAHIKAELLIKWGIQHGNIQSWKKISNINESNFGRLHIRLPYRIILYLCKIHIPYLVRIYARAGVNIKKKMK